MSGHRGGGGGSGGANLNSVFYAESYHPIQAGSIDGTDVLPHDNAVYRALLCYNAALYDPFGDPKLIGDPYCTLFVARLSHQTNEDTLRKAMSQYGRVKSLRLVRHIVTGASRGYAFVEFETEKEMRRAYKDAHHTFIDDSEIIVDYNRQQLMPGWIPRRLGGGLGGKKESGQLRFGGRERPFRAPLRQIPWDDLKRLGIPPPPEGRYMSRFQIPSPPRKRGRSEGDELNEQRRKRNRCEVEDYDDFNRHRTSSRRSSSPDRAHSGGRSRYSKEHHHKSHRQDRRSVSHETGPSNSGERRNVEREERGHRHHRDSHKHDDRRNRDLHKPDDRWTPGEDD